MAEKTTAEYVSMTTAVNDFARELKTRTEDDFFPTGYPSHDNALGRLRRGSVTFVGARPSMGKTAFQLCSALAQMKAGIKVYFFSLEMPRSDMIARLVSIQTGIPLLDILQHRCTVPQLSEITAVLPRWNSYPRIGLRTET